MKFIILKTDKELYFFGENLNTNGIPVNNVELVVIY